MRHFVLLRMMLCTLSCQAKAMGIHPRNEGFCVINVRIRKSTGPWWAMRCESRACAMALQRGHLEQNQCPLISFSPVLSRDVLCVIAHLRCLRSMGILRRQLYPCQGSGAVDLTRKLSLITKLASRGWIRSSFLRRAGCRVGIRVWHLASLADR